MARKDYSSAVSKATVWAFPGYDFDGHRQAWVNYMVYLSGLDRAEAEQRASERISEQ